MTKSPRGFQAQPPNPSVMLLVGTRPEAVKIAPLVLALRDRRRLTPVLVDTGQHPDLVPQALEAFGLRADIRLSVDRSGSSLTELVPQLLSQIDRPLRHASPSCVVVQGDTATTLAGALAAFWRCVPVVHLEAGLRSGDLKAPFPEEGNRKVVTQIASLHLAPTAQAAANLRAESALNGPVLITGNTVVDAVLSVPRSAGWLERGVGDFVSSALRSNARLVLCTAHRRESWGEPLGEVLRAVSDLVIRHPDVRVIFSTHPNPVVRTQVANVLGEIPQILVTESLPYSDLVQLLRLSALVLSDSGGIQEEAPAFGTPVLVLRDVTERVEALESGCARLVGTDRARIVSVASALLSDERARCSMSGATNPFGDGRAAARCEEAIAWLLGLTCVPPEQFAGMQASPTSDGTRVA